MSISKRILDDGSTVYDVRVYVSRNADGSYNRRSVTCRTLKSARVEEAKMIAERDAMRGRHGKMSLSTYIDRYYWPVASKRLAATSLDTYEKEIRLRIKPTLGKTDLRNINRAQIQAMLDGIATESVARKTLGTLKTILNEAKGDGLILSNPATAKYAMPPKGSKRDNGLVLTNFDQIHDFLSIVSKNGSQCVQRLSFTGLLLGLRPEERYALNWLDFDTDKMTVTIDSAYVIASAKHGGVQEKETKTPKSARTIPLPTYFIDWFDGLPCGGGAFIVGADGNRISPSTAQKRWRNYLAKHPELPQVTLENMRHSFATAYLADGGRIEVLSRLLGHTNISTTINRYYKPDIESLRF